MHKHLTAYITTGPVTRPEAAWAKAAHLPHLSFAAAHLIVVIFAVLVLVGLGAAFVKWAF
jgi:hypothetical protein